MQTVPWSWQAAAAAPAADLQQLVEISPIELPQSYLQLLSTANGYEGRLSVDPLNLVLYPANEVIEIAMTGTFEKFFPGFFVIGGSGGGDAVAFDTRPGREGRVVNFDMTNIDLAESVRDTAQTFDQLLTQIKP